MRITSPDEPKYDADFAAVRQFRASVCVLGPLVGRCKRAKVALPGGDAIGSRPLDMHQAGLRQLGARCNIEHGCVVAEADHLRGAEIQLEFPSVGATENILMAAVLAEGVTTIHNAAREPDVVDLCTMLNQMGAQIEGAGSSTMTITGVDRLHPTEHRVIGDRIVAATWGIAAAMTRGDISVTGVDPQHLQLVLHKLHDAGATVTQTDDGFRVVQYERPKAVNVATLPFPGFPTDLQPMAIGLASIADGTSMITENVFEARFRFVEEMIRLGADARTDGHHAVVRGIPQLSSAPVWSSDIRAGAGPGAGRPGRRRRHRGPRRVPHRSGLSAVRREPGQPGCRDRAGRIARAIASPDRGGGISWDRRKGVLCSSSPRPQFWTGGRGLTSLSMWSTVAGLPVERVCCLRTQ